MGQTCKAYNCESSAHPRLNLPDFAARFSVMQIACLSPTKATRCVIFVKEMIQEIAAECMLMQQPLFDRADQLFIKF